MRQGWWHFWSTAVWRQWAADLATWRSDRTARAVLTDRIAGKSGAIARTREFAAQTKRALSWVEALSPRALPLDLLSGEIGLGEIPGVALFEEQRRLGRGQWIRVAQGSLYFTNQRMLFEGSRGLGFRYSDLTDASLGSDGFRLAIGSRSYLIKGPGEQIDISLVAAEALASGVDPMDTVLDSYREARRRLANEENELNWLHGQLRKLAPSRPRSPALVPAGLLGLMVIGFLSANQLFGGPVTSEPESLVRGTLYELATATGVVDAETISVRFPDGTEERVRLIGIDAPTGVAPRADEATEFLTDLVAGKEVWLVADTTNRDSTGRLLRYVYIADGTEFVNMTMVESGFAVAQRDTEFAAELAAAPDS